MSIPKDKRYEVTYLTPEEAAKLPKIKNPQSITDLFDQAFMEAYKVNDDQYDFICENATEEELSILCESDFTFDGSEKIIPFATKRKMVLIVQKYKKLYAENNANLDF